MMKMTISKRKYKKLIENLNRLINALSIIKYSWGTEYYTEKIETLINLKIYFQQQYKEGTSEENHVGQNYS